jgi:hypothetical protein
MKHEQYVSPSTSTLSMHHQELSVNSTTRSTMYDSVRCAESLATAVTRTRPDKYRPYMKYTLQHTCCCAVVALSVRLLLALACCCCLRGGDVAPIWSDMPKPMPSLLYNIVRSDNNSSSGSKQQCSSVAERFQIMCANHATLRVHRQHKNAEVLPVIAVY